MSVLGPNDIDSGEPDKTEEVVRTRRLVMLDIDGVVNTNRSCRSPKRGVIPGLGYNVDLFDPECVGRANAIASLTGARFVLSSAWRYIGYNIGLLPLLNYFREQGLAVPVVGMTPQTLPHHPERGDEIDDYLKMIGFFHARGYRDRLVILDDNSDMGELGDHLVQTTMKDGITDEHVKQVVERLK
jgi:hypothetical protein